MYKLLVGNVGAVTASVLMRPAMRETSIELKVLSKAQLVVNLPLLLKLGTIAEGPALGLQFQEAVQDRLTRQAEIAKVKPNGLVARLPSQPFQ